MELFSGNGIPQIISHQRKLILKILDSNEDNSVNSMSSKLNSNFNWKVLIMDKETKDIVSSLINVGDLREIGITLILEINERKESIRGIEGVYLIKPTMENIKQIVDDICGLAYDQISIHSIYELSNDLIEFLARELSKRSLQNRVKNLSQNYFSYRAITENLFTLDIQNSFGTLASPSVSEFERSSSINMIT